MPTAPKNLFETPDENGVQAAWVVEDLSVHIAPTGTIAIAGPAGARIEIDLDGAAELSAVLVDAVRILQEHGHRSSRGSGPVRLLL